MADHYSHPTAVVDEGAQVGRGTRVWHYCHVMGGARIGAGCVLGQNVFVATDAVIGDRCKLQNNVSVYRGVVLEEEVFVGPSAVFTNVINPRAFIERKDQFGKTTVRKGASIGANATIVCPCEIGEYAMIGAGAVVTTDVEPHALMVGVPAKRVGSVCRCGTTLRAGNCSDCGWKLG